MASTSPKAHIVDYDSAVTFLNGRNSRKVENNTYLERLDGGSVGRIGLRLHGTYVVEYMEDGRVRLFTGGWHSVTTKDRLNKYSRANVYQRKYEWFINDGYTYDEGYTNFEPINERKFIEGMEV